MMRSSTVPVRVLAVLAVLPVLACTSQLSVSATPIDVQHMVGVESALPNDPFFIPAAIRFRGPLDNKDTVVALPQLAFTGRGDRFEYPLYDVVRDACRVAVARSFKPNNPPAEFLRDDELEIEFRLAQYVMETEGGPGKAVCGLHLGATVRFPHGGRTVHSFTIPVEAQGEIDGNGTGTGGPGVLWIAAGRLAENLARELQGPGVRNEFRDKDRWVAWRSSADGIPPPPGEMPTYDVRNSWGKYQPVVRLGGR